MLIKVITLPFSSAHGGFNDEEAVEFLRDKELISVSDYIFTRNEIPYLTLVLKYFPYRTEVNPTERNHKQNDDDWRKMLSEEQMGLFNLLRDWRSKRCKKEGVPPYVILNNRQLALLVQARPQSLADLVRIEGIGKKKVDNYGAEILEITLYQKSSTEMQGAEQKNRSPDDLAQK